MWPPHLKGPSRTGRSTRQIKSLPFGSTFVTTDVVQHAAIAAGLKREDIFIVPPGWIEWRYWRGIVCPAIEVDHAVPRDEEFDHLLARARRHCCISVGASA